MLEFLEGKASDRKLRLFGVACCRRIWHLLTDERGRNAVEVAERFADAIATTAERRAAAVAAWQWLEETADADSAPYFAMQSAADCTRINAYLAASEACANVQNAISTVAAYRRLYEDELSQLVVMLLDIIGNPFRPVLINPKCLTPTVTSLATAAYEERSLPSGELDTARLAVLADALEEAGCQDQSILDHLRSPGPHVRGCWPLELILGRV
jgi:hypothetical protein